MFATDKLVAGEAGLKQTSCRLAVNVVQNTLCS